MLVEALERCFFVASGLPPHDAAGQTLTYPVEYAASAGRTIPLFDGCLSEAPPDRVHDHKKLSTREVFII